MMTFLTLEIVQRQSGFAQHLGAQVFETAQAETWSKFDEDILEDKYICRHGPDEL